jgi:hypothetical protein
MAIANNEKHKQYAKYANHCLTMEIAAGDPDMRGIQREMAVEWLKLADAILHPADLHADPPFHHT